MKLSEMKSFADMNCETRQFIRLLAGGRMCEATKWAGEHYDRMPEEVQEGIDELVERAGRVQ